MAIKQVEPEQKVWKQCKNCGTNFVEKSEGQINCYYCNEDLGISNKPDKDVTYGAGFFGKLSSPHQRHLERQREIKNQHQKYHGLRNTDYFLEHSREYKQSEQGKIQSYNNRMKRKGMIGAFTLYEWNIRIFDNNSCCYYCGKKLDANNLTRDHLIPFSKGGTNFIENVVPACVDCNRLKHNRDYADFLNLLRIKQKNNANFQIKLELSSCSARSSRAELLSSFQTNLG